MLLPVLRGYPNNDIIEIPFYTSGSAILFSITSIIYYFRIQPLYLCREMSKESLYQIWYGTNPQAEKWWISAPPAIKLKLVAILSTPRESPWHHYWENPVVRVIMTFLLTDIDSVILISLWFWHKIADAKRTAIPGPECMCIQCRIL